MALKLVKFSSLNVGDKFITVRSLNGYIKTGEQTYERVDEGRAFSIDEEVLVDDNICPCCDGLGIAESWDAVGFGSCMNCNGTGHLKH